MSEHQVALDTFPYGVYICTCKAGEKMNGLTLGWVTQVSMDPTLVAIAVYKEWYSHGILSEGDFFILHVLDERQVELGKHFGSTHGWDTDKFERADWKPGIEGIPILQGCRAVIACKKVREVPVGDHTIFVGEIISSHVDDTKREQILDRNIYFD